MSNVKNFILILMLLFIFVLSCTSGTQSQFKEDMVTPTDTDGTDTAQKNHYQGDIFENKDTPEERIIKCEDETVDKNKPYIRLSCKKIENDSILIEVISSPVENVSGEAFHIDYDQQFISIENIESEFDNNKVKSQKWHFIRKISDKDIVGAVAIFEGASKSNSFSNQVKTVDFENEMVISSFKVKIKKSGTTYLSIISKDSAFLTDKGLIPVKAGSIKITIKGGNYDK